MRIFTNPIVIKEFQAQIRTKKVLFSHFLYLTILGIFAFIVFLVYNFNYEMEGEAGKAILIAFMGVQLAFTALYCAAFSSTSVINEKIDKTLDLVLLTPLKYSEIIAGKAVFAVLYYLIFLIEGLPVLILIMIIGGFGLVDVFAGIVIILFFLLLISALGLCYSSAFDKARQAIVSTFSFLIIYGFFIMFSSSIFNEIYRNSLKDINLIAVLNPAVVFMSFLESSSATVDFFGRSVNIFWAFFTVMAGFILFFMWYGANTLKTYNENSRVFEPKFFIFSFIALYILLLLFITPLEETKEILGSLFTMPLLFTLFIAIPAFINDKTQNTVYKRETLVSKLCKFAERREFSFITLLCLFSAIVFPAVIIWLKPYWNFSMPQYKIYAYQSIAVFSFIFPYMAFHEIFSYFFSASRKRIGINLLLIFLWMFFTLVFPMVSAIQEEFQGKTDTAVINSFPANPVTALLLIEDSGQFPKEYRISPKRTAAYAAAFNLILFIIVKLAGYKYIKKKLA